MRLRDEVKFFLAFLGFIALFAMSAVTFWQVRNLSQKAPVVVKMVAPSATPSAVMGPVKPSPKASFSPVK